MVYGIIPAEGQRILQGGTGPEELEADWEVLFVEAAG